MHVHITLFSLVPVTTLIPLTRKTRKGFSDRISETVTSVQ